MTASSKDIVALDDRHARGMAIMTAAMLMLPLMDVAGKWLATVDQLSPGQIALIRFLVQFAVLVPVIVLLRGFSGLYPRHLSSNLLRGALLGLASMIFFVAVKYMPVADAIAVFFVEPLILTALSAVVLKETVGWRRRIAVVIGFVGALIVIQPSYALFGAVSLLPLCTALLFAFYLVLNKQLAIDDEPVVMQMVAGAGASITLGLIVLGGSLAGIEDMTPTMPLHAISWALLISIGLISAGGHMMVIQALRYAPASLLAPFQYFEIVTAAGLGLLIFGDFPTLSKWIGIAIIIGSGLYTYWRERELKHRETVEVAD
ncbi:MAG: DMT family transporter [Rhizobiaceae bacterium]